MDHFPELTLMLEIDAEALRRLMEQGQLVASDFRCPQQEDRMRVKRWCLEHLGLQLRR